LLVLADQLSKKVLKPIGGALYKEIGACLSLFKQVLEKNQEWSALVKIILFQTLNYHRETRLDQIGIVITVMDIGFRKSYSCTGFVCCREQGLDE